MSNRSVYRRAKSILRVLCVAFPCFALGLVASPAFGQQESVEGKWFPPIGGTNDGVPNNEDGGDHGWPLAAIDAALLSTGQVLVWAGGTNAWSWNPADGVSTPVNCDSCVVPTLHCPGHAFLTDGSLLVAGGGDGGGVNAHKETRIFRVTGGWEKATVMNYERWYPTCTTLPDGSVLAAAGLAPGGNGLDPRDLQPRCQDVE